MTLRLLLAPSIGTARARARAELLEASLADELGEPVAIEMSESYEQLEEHARGSEVELVWAPPAVVARIEPLARAILKCVRSGHSSYRSALVMRRGEQASLTSAEGLRAVWVDPMSMGGYLLAMDYLLRNAEVTRLLGAQRFVGSYPDALREVVYEQADVTAVGVHSDDPTHIEEAIARFAGRVQGERLAHVAVTREVPTDALIVTDALETSKLERLRSRLVPEEPGKRAPAGLCLALEVEGFVPARPGEYETVRELLDAKA